MPRSVELLKQGEAHLAAGRFVEADEAFETALAVDPRNRAAYIALARVASARSCSASRSASPRRRSLLEPNDRDAIAIQGEAMVELGAVARAKENLAKLQKLCPSGCPQLAELVGDDHARADGRFGQAAGSSEEQLSPASASARGPRNEFGNADRLGTSRAVDAEFLQRIERAGTSFRLDRSIFRRWPKAASVSRSSTFGSTPSG